jgi:hypothetical protein
MNYCRAYGYLQKQVKNFYIEDKAHADNIATN